MGNNHQIEENQKIIALNEELENYFGNTVIPQLFVDSNLTLRKFTPPAMNQFRLTDADTGRPVSEITKRMGFPAILENIIDVMASKVDLEKEIQTIDRKWYWSSPLLIGQF
jgi:two-component system, OmpR family, phosphate regulon sensor histidine kinase PhoR